LSPIERVAERELGAVLAVAVQTWGLVETSTVSQLGWPETDQLVKVSSLGVTVMLPEPPASGAEAPEAFRLTTPRLKRRAVELARAFVLKLDTVASTPNSSSMPTVALRPPPNVARLGCTSR
jgi:hypothetical protein